MQSLVEQLSFYANTHTNFINRILHYIGIPLVIFSLMIFFGWIHIKVPNFFDMPLSWLLTILVLIYYFFLDLILGAAATVVFAIFNLIAAYFSQPAPSWLGLKVFVVTFVLGCILLLIGHLLEKKKPAFMSAISQLLIGPLYIIAETLFCFGLKKDLEESIKNQ